MNATLQGRGMEIKERGLSEQVVDCFFNGLGVVLSREVGKGKHRGSWAPSTFGSI